MDAPPLPGILVGESSGDWTAAIFPQYEQGFRGSLMRTMASAVFMADILLFMMEKGTPSGGIHSAFWHTFCNDAQALFSIEATRDQGLSYKGKCTDPGYGYRMPIYWVSKLLSEQRGDELVMSRLEGENTIAAPPDGRYTDPPYEFARVAHLASRTGSRLYLALINKDAHRPVDVRIRVRDWKVQPAVEVYEVGAESYLAENTIEQPDRVKLQGPETRRLTGERVYRLKPNTLAVLRFRDARSRR